MIEFNTQDFKEVERKLAKWQKQFTEPKELLSELGDLEVKRTKQRFKSKTDPDGNKWVGWDRDTQEERDREGSTAGGLLFDSGALFHSIQYQIKGNKLEVGTPLEYGQYLQDGTLNMPAREFLGFNDRTQSDMAWLIDTVFEG